MRTTVDIDEAQADEVDRLTAAVGVTRAAFYRRCIDLGIQEFRQVEQAIADIRGEDATRPKRGALARGGGG